MQTEELRQSFSSHARSNQVNGNCKLCLIESLQKAFVLCTVLSAQIEELRQDRVTHVGSTQEGDNSQLGGVSGCSSPKSLCLISTHALPIGVLK